MGPEPADRVRRGQNRESGVWALGRWGKIIGSAGDGDDTDEIEFCASETYIRPHLEAFSARVSPVACPWPYGFFPPALPPKLGGRGKVIGSAGDGDGVDEIEFCVSRDSLAGKPTFVTRLVRRCQ